MVASSIRTPETSTSPAAIIERVLSDALAPTATRDQRSAEFITGARTVLLQLLIGKPLASPYPVATAAADAFFAGVEAGRAIYTDSHAHLLQHSRLDPYAGLRGHDYIAARNLNKPVQRVQPSAHSSSDEVVK